MRKLEIVTLDDYSDSLVNSLHDAGVVQINDFSKRVEEDAEWREILKPSGVSPHSSNIISFLTRITNITEFWANLKTEKVSPLKLLKSFINPEIPEKIEIKESNMEEILENAEDLLNKVESRTLIIQQRLEELESLRIQLDANYNSAKYLEFLDIDISYLVDIDYTYIITGRISLEIYEKFKKEVNGLTDEIVLTEDEGEEETKKTVVIINLKKYKEELDKILRKFEFERFEISRLTGKPKDAIKEIEIEIENIEKEKNDLIGKTADIADKWKKDVLILREQLEIEREKSEIFSSFAKTDKTYMLGAWVKEKDLDEALEIIKTSTEGHSIVDVKNPDGEDNIPVHLENPRFAKPYEFMTNMYSPPQYNEIDPTILFAIVFPFFFGFCLTDGFYGILNAIVGFILFRGIGKTNNVIRSFGIILIACGVWAIILGLATNGFMGDLFPTYLGIEIPFVIEAIDSFANPQNILIMALIVGVIHVILGLVLGAYNNLKKGSIGDALGDQICWLIFITGVILLGVTYLFNIGSTYIGIGVAIVGLMILVYKNGAFGLMDVMGLLGTVLSYSRLLALALSTGGMALTVNLIAFRVVGPIPYIGVVLAMLVFLLGHPANAAMQSLGAFIHSMRLHYIEFFGQFYKGEGTSFKPFSAKRKFTKIEGK